MTDGRYAASKSKKLIEQDGGWYFTHATTTDADGRYSIAEVLSGTRLALSAASGIPSCAAVATVVGHTALDIDVLKSRSDPSPTVSPTLSGLVFYTADGARRPFRDGSGISFYSDSVAGGHIPIAWTVSGDEGRFELCRLPEGPAKVIFTSWDPVPITRQINVQGDAAVEVEVRPF